MKFSPIYGWPIAEDDDPRKEYPIMVDDPRTIAIEQELTAQFATSRMTYGMTANTAALPGTTSVIPMTTVKETVGTDLIAESGHVRVATAGEYLLGGQAVLVSLPVGAQFSFYLSVKRGAEIAQIILGGGKNPSAVSLLAVAASQSMALQANDTVDLSVYLDTAGAVAGSACTIIMSRLRKT